MVDEVERNDESFVFVLEYAGAASHECACIPSDRELPSEFDGATPRRKNCGEDGPPEREDENQCEVEPQ